MFKKKFVVLIALISIAMVVTMSSCNKDNDTVADSTLVIYCRGYTIGTQPSTEYTPQAVQNGDFAPLKGVVIKLENGQSYTSDENGKITITLPSGSYRYRRELPNGWGITYSTISSYDSESGTYVYTYTVPEVRPYGTNEWDQFNINYGGGTWISQFYFYKN